VSSFTQTGEDGRILVKGEIKDQNLKPVSYSHILLKSRNEGCVGDYYGNFRIDVFPGDTLVFSAVSYHHAVIPVPDSIISLEYCINVILQQDTVYLKELVVYPWPSTYEQFREEFIEMEIEDPIADLHLNLPSPEEMRNLARPQGGLVMPGPFSILYDQFSKEARSKRTYAELMRKDKADKRYNRIVVSRITGLKDEDEIIKFMHFCSLQIKFILESTDYELYAAILDCYHDFCKFELGPGIPRE
jgi:hypothetical protein